jgi:hypothetical protein
MAEKLLKEEYKTPLAMVRGVFLCDGIADTVSVKVIPISQDVWPTTDIPVGNTNWDGDIDLRF